MVLAKGGGGGVGEGKTISVILSRKKRKDLLYHVDSRFSFFTIKLNVNYVEEFAD